MLFAFNLSSTAICSFIAMFELSFINFNLSWSSVSSPSLTCTSFLCSINFAFSDSSCVVSEVTCSIDFQLTVFKISYWLCSVHSKRFKNSGLKRLDFVLSSSFFKNVRFSFSEAIFVSSAVTCSFSCLDSFFFFGVNREKKPASFWSNKLRILMFWRRKLSTSI